MNSKVETRRKQTTRIVMGKRIIVLARTKQKKPKREIKTKELGTRRNQGPENKEKGPIKKRSKKEEE